MKVVVTSPYIPMDFEWDSEKAESNLRKHGITFDTAILAFTDPFAQSHRERIESYEQRWQTVGRVQEKHLLVVHTVSEANTDQTVEVIRIISARQANRKERRVYEQENG